MFIRDYGQADAAETAELFYETVHAVSAKDYSPDQLAAWAPKERDLGKWDRSFDGRLALVAIEGNLIVGFADLDRERGYLDRLYVHKDYQGRGIASALCDRLEAEVEGEIKTDASITARPFFEKRGYRVKEEQEVERCGILLRNFRMVKEK